MKSIRVVIFLTALGGIVLGIFISKYSKGIIQIEPKFNITDLLTLIITAGIAYYIPTIVQKALNTRRNEQDQLIKRVEIVLTNFLYIDDLVSSSHQVGGLTNLDASNIIAKFQVISREIFTLIDLGKKYCSPPVQKHLNELKVMRSVYKKIVTGGNFQAQGFTYDISTIIRARKAISIINSEISFLIFEVNAG